MQSVQVQERMLRPYQVQGVFKLVAKLLGGCRQFLISAPCGAGKSLIGQAALRKLIDSGRFKYALVITPQIQIEDSWRVTGSLSIKIPDVKLNAKHVPRTTTLVWREEEWQNIRDPETAKVKESFILNTLKARDPGVSRVGVTSHQQFVRIAKKLFRDCKDLSGRILLIDEAHRLGEELELTKARDKWIELGGTVVYVTATPFRDFDEFAIPDNIERWTWSIAEHMAAGNAPSELRIRVEPLTEYVALNADELEGKRVSKKTGAGSEIVRLWESDGRPKLVVCVPPDQSKAWASRLEKAFKNAGARVWNAVGIDSATKNAFVAGLLAERLALETSYEASSVDVILACKRFDEGSDWAACSHVYSVGLSRSFKLIQQRLGRTLRDKRETRGYPKKHAEEAHFVFLVPGANQAAWEKYQEVYKEHDFLLAAFLHDHDTAMAYRGTVQKRLDDVGRERGSYRVKEDIWAEVIEKTKLNAKEVAEAGKLIGQAQGRLKLNAGNDKPTNAEVLDFLENEMEVDSAALDQVRLVLTYRIAAEDKRALEVLITRYRKLASGAVPVSALDPQLRAIFLDVIKKYENEVCPDYFSGIMKHLAKFRGQTILSVTRELKDRLEETFFERLRRMDLEMNPDEVRN